MGLKSLIEYLFPFQDKKKVISPQEQKQIAAQTTTAQTNQAVNEAVKNITQTPLMPKNETQKPDNVISQDKNIFENTSPLQKQTTSKTLIGDKRAKKAFKLDLFSSKPKNKETTPPKEKETKSSDEEQKKIFEQGLSSMKDLIAPTSFTVKTKYCEMSGMHIQSFYIYNYPRYIDSNWLSPLISFEANIDISIFAYPIGNEKIMKTLRNKVGQMRSHIRVASESGKPRDPNIEAALEDAEELRDKLARGEEKFFQFGLYLSIYHEDKTKLDKIVKQIQTVLAGKLILSRPAILRQEQALNTTLPLCQDELNITRNMNTSPLSSAFPFNSSDLTSDEGILYGLNRHNNSLVIFDRFKLPNANSVVFATSGAGKSYAVKLEVLRSLMLGTDVIVIDPENEYEALCSTLGGSYMKVSLNSDRRINPFDLPLPIEGQEEQPGDLLRSNIIALEGLISIMMGGSLTPEEKALLDKALLDTYALKGITLATPNPGTIPPPTMEDLYDVLSEMHGGKDLSIRLAQYTQGIFAGIFNKQTNVDLGSGLICFSIRDLEEGLRPSAMFVILNYIWNRIRSKMKKRLLIVDEAWNLMQYEDSAKFIYGLAKRCRKYYLGLTTITQDVGDFLKNDYGKAIVTNSAMQLLLKQAPSAIDDLTKTFNLTDGEKYYLLNSAQGEGIFFAGHKHVALQIIASYSEHKMITTNPEELIKEKEKEKEFVAT